ncbi:hypothetical protein MYIN104542_00215 [Mycobacterium intermedium]
MDAGAHPGSSVEARPLGVRWVRLDTPEAVAKVLWSPDV